jgi:predicted DNA-binding transcriptional regulator YafY
MEKYVTRLALMDKMIRRKSTGTPKELSHKLQVSESTIFRLLRTMRESMGLKIEWNPEHNSYVYRADSIKFNLEKLILSAQE